MTLLFGEETATPVFSRTASTVLRRRLGELLGVVMMAAAAALAIAFASYDVGDPSHFSSTPQPPSNLLGRPGAMVADPMMRYFGVVSWAFALWLGVWGWRCLAHRGAHRVWLTLPTAPIALILALVFASLHPPHASWPLSTGLGGLFGDSGVYAFYEQSWFVAEQSVRTLVLALAVGLIVIGPIALGVNLREARAILTWLVLSLIRLAALGGRALAAGGSAALRSWREHRARPRSERLEPAEPTGSWKRRAAAGAPEEEDAPAGADTATRTPPAGAAAALAGAVGRMSLPRLGMPQIALPGMPFGRGRGAEAAPGEEPDVDGEQERRQLASAIERLRSGPATNRITGLEEEEAPRPAVAQPDPRVQQARRPAKKSRRAEAEAQPTLFDADAGIYDAPPLALLQPPRPVVREHESQTALDENARMLETVLEDYGVRGEITAVKAGPVVTLYELEPAPGLKASRVIGLADDIARSMSALAARIATVPGRSVIGIELPNARREQVLLRELFESASYGDGREKLALALGKDIAGAPVVTDLARMPHLLIAGTTGSGKSVAINTMILSLLYRLSPEQCRLIMIDPKMLELSVYDNIPHLLSPVVTDPKKAVVALKWVVSEMEERYRKMSKMGVRNIEGYNARVREALEKGEEFSRTIHVGFNEETGDPVYETETFEPQEMPFIVVIVDEMADLMMVAGKEIEACIQRLAQMARASGIHLIMATQRPSVDVITGTIKANFPTRISFQVTSKIDSRTILGEQGAEQLLGQGDMLYMAGGGRIRRVHGPFVSDEEVEEVVAHLKSLGAPDYVGAVTEGGDEETQSLVDEKLGLAVAGDGEDELYDKAVAIVARDRKCSTSYIQRKLAIGYNKAARLVEQMETQGVVSPANAVGKRDILIEER